MGDSAKNIVVFSGAGISEESGIKTFRDSGGLWEEYDIADVATPEAWHRHPKVVLEFYNARRRQVVAAKPNAAHIVLKDLESKFNIQIITQNIDDLHERAGSSKVLHLHGEIRKSRSSINDKLIYPINGDEIKWGDHCELGSQLRPHVVWFGEEVPAMMEAELLMNKADVLIVVGTSLNVYPAANLIYMARTTTEIYVVDPGTPFIPNNLNIKWIREKASKGLEQLVQKL